MYYVVQYITLITEFGGGGWILRLDYYSNHGHCWASKSYNLSLMLIRERLNLWGVTATSHYFHFRKEWSLFLLINTYMPTNYILSTFLKSTFHYTRACLFL